MLALYHNDMSSCAQKVLTLMKRQGRDNWTKIRRLAIR